MSTVTIAVPDMQQILAGLIGRDITSEPVDSVSPHPATYRGLVTNEDELQAVIAADLDFAHRTGGAWRWPHP